MALIVEDGTGNPAAESYASVATCINYASLRGLSFSGTPLASAEQALRRATSFIDQNYGSSFAGVKRRYRSQNLEWPRAGATDRDGIGIKIDEIPIELINATCEVAVREFASPNSIFAPSTTSSTVDRLKVDVLEISYGQGPTTKTDVDVIRSVLSGILAPLLSSSTASAYVGSNMR